MVEGDTDNRGNRYFSINCDVIMFYEEILHSQWLNKNLEKIIILQFIT